MICYLQNGGTAAEAAKKREHDESGLANNPFPSTPPGMMGSTGYALGALAADPNRAFQTINAETLEQASKTAEITEPSQAVSVLLSWLLSACGPTNLRHQVVCLKQIPICIALADDRVVR